MTDTRYPHVFRPFTLGGVEIRNRIFLPAHTTNFARDFLPTPEHAAYLAERARGGAGLVIVEPLRVHRTSLGRSGGLSGSDREALPGLRAMVEAVRREGARIFVQITHAGRHGENAVDRLPAWGPSAVPWVAGGEMPHAMTRREMDAVRAAYVEAAQLAVEAGFEGMEVHLGHGHLLHQFLSPGANRRTDAWGGSLENRMRYPLEVLAAVIAAVGERVPVGVRLSVADLMPEGEGLSEEDQLRVAGAASAVPGVAFVNASVAAYQVPSIGHHVADMSAPPHPFLEQTLRLREVIGAMPLLTANRYARLEHAEAALARGLDMVGMNRAQMADPALLEKARAGREDDIRPCVANNFCLEQVALHRPITCMMNPRVGREASWPERPAPVADPRRVLVLGGGPAGLEAARLAALAGHDVTLWERSDTLGGQLVVAGTGAGRGDLHRMRDWLVRQVTHSGARIEMGRDADVESVVSHGADCVILATGPVAVAPSLKGARLRPVIAALSPEAGQAGDEGAIWDEAGGWATLTAAETLARAGARVSIISRPDGPLWAVTVYSRMTALERLAGLGVAMRPGMVPLEAEADGRLLCRNRHAPETLRLGPFSTIFHAGRGEGAFALQSALEDVGCDVRPVGDAAAPRSLLEAMHDAHRVARALHDRVARTLQAG
ncbi:MAG: FAD-dependent oxidoreductase [Rhodobacteraceae bacterium]|nr:FAD-dependent oxidoreductase [Paracoccaceae bacterium]